MNPTIQIAPVRKSVVVEATPARAFEVFTAGIDRWWPKTHGIGTGPIRKSIIEPCVGGRWYTTHEDGSQVVVGHVRVWEPGVRFVFSWEITGNFKPEPRAVYASEVELLFTAEAPGRTRVDLEHRNFERMEGDGGEKMRGTVDGGWVLILGLFVTAVSQGASQS